MSGSYYALNSKYQSLLAILAGIQSGTTPVPTSSGLADVLINNNSAGTTDINMNFNDIINCDNLSVNTINGAPLPPGTTPTLEDVLTAGNVADLNINIVDLLVTPTQSVQISPNSISMNCDDGTGSITTSIGDPNVNGSAFAGLGAIVNNTASMSLSCGSVSSPPFFQPPTGTVSITATPTTSQVNLASGGQFLNAKSVQMDLNGTTHNSSDGSENYTIASNGYVNINAGDATYGFKKTRFNTNATSSAYQAEADNTGIKAYQTTSPSTYAQLQTNEIRCNNGSAGSSYFSYGGFTTAGTTQSVALQPTQLIATNDFSILTQTVGDISIYAKDTLNLRATDNVASGKGISIDKTTPNIWYNLNTANVNDRLVISNNGSIECVSGIGASPQGYTLQPNSFILQNLDLAKTMEMDTDLGMRYTSSSGSVTNATYTPVGMTIDDTAGVGFKTTMDYLSLDIGSTASTTPRATLSGAGGTLTLNQSTTGYTTTPSIKLNNYSSTAGNTNGVPSVETYKRGRNAVAGDYIYSQSHYALNSAGVKTEFARVEASVRNTGVGNDDGSMSFSALQNGTFTTYFTINGADNENNCFLPLDMNGQAIKSSTTNLTLSATASSGTGSIIIAPKSSTGDLQLDGANIASATAGGSSGNHLRIKLNGVYYKIALLND